jgi:hypothetical protein|tara:strand:+ start:422 stop:634 length:213 start_codon:yes stop_codon:yes gene_type:complete
VAKGDGRFHFIYKDKPEKLSDEQLREEKYEADIYIAIFRRVKDKLNCDERHRILSVNREFRKRKLRLRGE